MGPRSEGARKARESHVEELSAVALQWGRARRERGKGRMSRAITAWYKMLQWGRARRERGKQFTLALAAFGGGRLQWGRARRERGKPPPTVSSHGMTCSFNGAALGGSAESHRMWWWNMVEQNASMGPRSEGARKAERVTNFVAGVVALQWGRARRERGKAGCRFAHGFAKVSFNGAALGGSAESRPGGRRPAASRGRFNGAALGGSAESTPALLGYQLLRVASMGPRSEGARKVALELDEFTGGQALQWGRARRERGKRCRGWMRRPTSTSFNGAALGGSAESCLRLAVRPRHQPGFNGAALGGSAER